MGLNLTRLTSNQTTKWRLQLFVLLAVACTLTIIYICWLASTSFYIIITRRPKTLIIYNNEHLCSSNASLLTNSHSRYRHRSISPSGKDTEPTTTIVFVIPSRRNNFMQRNLIRRTYGSIRSVNNVNILAVVFMLGSADTSHDPKTDLSQLNAESFRFGDIIMGDLVDTYRNLSRKSIMAYDWLTSYCREADLVVKTDDDVFVDIFKLTAELGQLPPSALDSLNFWCAVHAPETIDRNPKSIYYVSSKQYARQKFPKHCAGIGYVTSMRLVRRIAGEISRSFRGPICSHEDVFMTGIVPEQINSNRSEPPVQFVDKMSDWIFYIDKDNPNTDGKYIWDVIDRPVNKSVDLVEFRKRSGTRVFYLLQHGVDFKKKFLRLWYLVEKSFGNEETIKK